MTIQDDDVRLLVQQAISRVLAEKASTPADALISSQKSIAIGDKGKTPKATAIQMESFYTHLYQALTDIGFMHPDKSKSIMRRLRRIYNRVQLDTKELDILRGILRMSQDNQRK